MKTARTYLDWNATAPLRPEARAAMLAAMDRVGNPSSVHAEGRAARSIVEEARESVAAAVGASPRNVIFTAGGTEANALALTAGFARADRGPCDVVIASGIEHVSVAGVVPGAAKAGFATQPDGVASLDDLRARLAAAATGGYRQPLVALMAANNETGVIQPVTEAAALVHAAGGLLHVDAVQALGKISLDINALGADLLAISAHKAGGPMGVGALVLAHEDLHPRALAGATGGQERNRRGGTENVIGIAGFGAAVRAAVRDLETEVPRLSDLRARLERGLRDIWPETVIFGESAARVCNTAQFSISGIRAETALIALDLEGIAVSSGSACSSGKVSPSAVIKAMGFDERTAAGAIRVSFGRDTGTAEIDAFLSAWRKVAQPLLKRREIAA